MRTLDSVISISAFTKHVVRSCRLSPKEMSDLAQDIECASSLHFVSIVFDRRHTERHFRVSRYVFLKDRLSKDFPLVLSLIRLDQNITAISFVRMTLSFYVLSIIILINRL